MILFRKPVPTFRDHALTVGSGHSAIRPRESAVSCKRTERFAGNQRVEPETLSCIGDHEEALHENQEDVEPRPFFGLPLEAKPEVGGEKRADHAQRPHQEA